MHRRQLSLSALVAIFSLQAPCHGDWQLKKGNYSSQGYSLRALLGKKEDSETVIRRIGAASDEAELHRLLDYADKATERGRTRESLEIVRAISRHSAGPFRERVVLLLADFFTPSTDASGAAPGNRNADLTNLVRGSSAMALARSQHPLAARLLLATAHGNQDEDPEGVRLARQALDAAPPSPTTREKVGAWATPKLRQLETAADLPPQNPTELVRLIQEEDQHHRSGKIETWATQLTRLRQEERWHGAWGEAKEWELAFTVSKTWTLRALALLTPPQDTIREKAVALAEESLDAREPTLLAAAAFCLASLSPEKAVRLLRHKSSVVRQAVLSQSHSGVLAIGARELSADSNESGLLALRASLDEPALWDTWSTRQLEGLKARLAPGNEWQGALAARFDDSHEATRAPNLSRISSWLEDADPNIRAGTIRGLARSRGKSSPGLLIETYRFESDPAVRRGICRALHDRGISTRPELAALLELEVDPGCRARLQGRSDPDARGFQINWTREKVSTMVDREGITHRVPPAPDGFVALVHPSL